MRDRGQRPGAADLDADLAQHRARPLRFEFLCDRPARRPADEAEPLLPVEAVDFEDDAVDVVVQPGAPVGELVVEGEHLALVAAEPGERIDREPERLEPVEERAVGIAQGLGELARRIGEEAQRPRGGDSGIELAQRAGGGVAWIGEDLGVRPALTRVEGGEVGPAHVDLAAHLGDGGRTGRAHRECRRGSGGWR